MRILFVSGTAVGGSATSTRELATALAARGHEVALLARVATAPRRWMLHHRLVNAAHSHPALAAPLSAVAGRIGRRTRVVRTEPFLERSTILVENSFGSVLASFGPDVVVAASIGRMAWRSVRADVAAAGIPSVLYMREESAIGHLAISDAPPDLLLANARLHEAAAREAGFTAHVVPSVVDLTRARVESTREVVLFVNPVEVSGRDLAVSIARACPDLRFAFVESWPLSADERAWLDAACAGLANVERRPRVDDLRLLYGDARVLLVPYRTNGRPRVVLEAQANGIPVLATDLPALTEAVGPGGVAVAPDAAPGEWAAALRDLLEPARYDTLSAAARTHAARDEVDTDAIVTRFEALVLPLVGAT
jgi:glycosyltransferase involved in cell wall biosynthesis